MNLVKAYFLIYQGCDEKDVSLLVKKGKESLKKEEEDVFLRYKVKRKQVEFVAGRLLLRYVLATDYGIGPLKLHFGERGKPYLPESPPFFNLSNSHEAIFLVVSLSDEVGCDLEKVRSVTSGVDKKVLHHGEQAMVKSENDFFKFWTAKEAYMKLTGKGFKVAPLDLFCDFNKGLVTQFSNKKEAHLRQFTRSDYVLSVATFNACEVELNEISLSSLLTN